MSGLPAQREPGRLWPELSEGLPGFPSWATLRPVFGGQPIRLEDQMKDGRYQIRAELPVQKLDQQFQHNRHTAQRECHIERPLRDTCCSANAKPQNQMHGNRADCQDRDDSVSPPVQLAYPVRSNSGRHLKSFSL